MSYDACSCDYEPFEFCNTETRKARKTHQCDECYVTIPVGESYEHVRGKCEGEIMVFKTCALCLELRRWAVISVPYFCFAYSTLHENIRDMVTEVRADVPRGFIFEWGRRIIAIQRRRYGVHWPRPVIRVERDRRLAEVRAEQRARQRAETHA
jgi:hypothetical protein